jgi:hypothetical protein
MLEFRIVRENGSWVEISDLTRLGMVKKTFETVIEIDHGKITIRDEWNNSYEFRDAERITIYEKEIEK